MSHKKFNFGPASSRDSIVFGAEAPHGNTVRWISFMKGTHGIERVCCLLENPCDLLHDYRLAFGEEDVIPAAIEDFHYSTEENLIGKIIPFLQYSIEKSQRVVVHCGAGNGRTGHVLAAWLCYKYDYEPDAAISAMLKIGRNPKEALENGFGTEEELQNLLIKSRELGRQHRKDRVKKQEFPIVQVTGLSVTLSLPEKGSKVPKKDGDTTIYGVDAKGNEKVCAQVPSEQFEEWSKTDPLWRQAQSAIFHRLLSDPSTRDTLIKINIQAALEKGNEDVAIRLWNSLSDSAKAALMAKPEGNNSGSVNNQ